MSVHPLPNIDGKRDYLLKPSEAGLEQRVQQYLKFTKILLESYKVSFLMAIF